MSGALMNLDFIPKIDIYFSFVIGNKEPDYSRIKWFTYFKKYLYDSCNLYSIKIIYVGILNLF